MRDEDLRALALRVGSELDERESRNTLQSWQLEDLQRALLFLTTFAYVLLEQHASRDATSHIQQARRRLGVEGLRNLRGVVFLANMGYVAPARRLMAALADAVLGLRYFRQFPDDAEAWVGGGGPDAELMRERLGAAGEPVESEGSAVPASRAAPPLLPLAALLGEGNQQEQVARTLQRVGRLGSDLVLLLAEGLEGAFDSVGTMPLSRSDLDDALSLVEALLLSSSVRAR
ncbi:MAG TPA: hypothetical protein VNL92_03415 [Dehalococcoidia bacterium]|nr:hypothetical protein [Dehalococcoidia bacterium]